MRKSRWRRWLWVAWGLAVLVGAVIAGPHGWAWYHWRQAQRELAAWRPQSARAALEQCLRVWHGIPQVHLLAAQAAWQMQDFDAARAQLHHAQRRRGQADDDTAFAWALLEAAAGNVLETEDYLQQQASRRPADAPLIWEALALGYLRTYRTLDAMTVCNHWLEQYPDHVRALELRGRTFITGQGVSRGAQDYRRALELDPNRDDTRWRLVEALITLSAYAEAAEHLEVLRRKWPDDAVIAASLARCYNMLGRHGDARQLLAATLDRHPDHPLCLRTHAQLLLTDPAGPDPAAAEAALRQAVARRPDDYFAQQLLFQALQQQGKTEQAQEQIRLVEALRERQHRLGELQSRKLAEQPLNPDLHYEMAQLLLQAGLEHYAENWLKTALSLDPQHRPSHQVLADLYARRGLTERAAYHRRLATATQDHSANPP